MVAAVIMAAVIRIMETAVIMAAAIRIMEEMVTEAAMIPETADPAEVRMWMSSGRLMSCNSGGCLKKRIVV